MSKLKIVHGGKYVGEWNQYIVIWKMWHDNEKERRSDSRYFSG